MRRVRLQFATACAGYAYNLLPYAQCTLAKQITGQFRHFNLIKLKPMKKVKIRKKLFWHIQMNLKGFETTFFLALAQSQKSLSAYTAHTLTNIKC